MCKKKSCWQADVRLQMTVAVTQSGFSIDLKKLTLVDQTLKKTPNNSAKKPARGLSIKAILMGTPFIKIALACHPWTSFRLKSHKLRPILDGRNSSHFAMNIHKII